MCFHKLLLTSFYHCFRNRSPSTPQASLGGSSTVPVLVTEKQSGCSFSGAPTCSDSSRASGFPVTPGDQRPLLESELVDGLTDNTGDLANLSRQLPLRSSSRASSVSADGAVSFRTQPFTFLALRSAGPGTGLQAAATPGRGWFTAENLN